MYVWIRVEDTFTGLKAMPSLFKAVVGNRKIQLNVIPKLSLDCKPGKLIANVSVVDRDQRHR